MSNGYYDPGKISGPPEDCYPQEGDDERTLTTILLSTINHAIIIDGDLADKLFSKYNIEISDVDINDEGSYPNGDYDPEDRWDDYDSDAAADAYERSHCG